MPDDKVIEAISSSGHCGYGPQKKPDNLDKDYKEIKEYESINGSWISVLMSGGSKKKRKTSKKNKRTRRSSLSKKNKRTRRSSMSKKNKRK